MAMPAGEFKIARRQEFNEVLSLIEEAVDLHCKTVITGLQYCFSLHFDTEGQDFSTVLVLVPEVDDPTVRSDRTVVWEAAAIGALSRELQLSYVRSGWLSTISGLQNNHPNVYQVDFAIFLDNE